MPESFSPRAKDLVGRMLTVDPTARITLRMMRFHPWFTLASPQFDPIGTSLYTVRADPESGAVYADEQLIGEMESAGYPRHMVLQHLLNADADYVTAGYYLLVEGKVAVLRRMRGPAAVRKYMTRSASGGSTTGAPGSTGADSGGHLTPMYIGGSHGGQYTCGPGSGSMAASSRTAGGTTPASGAATASGTGRLGQGVAPAQAMSHNEGMRQGPASAPGQRGGVAADLVSPFGAGDGRGGAGTTIMVG